MGTIRENKLKHKANQIARYAYGLFASGKGTGSLGISQGEFRTLGKTREEVFKGLTDKYYKRLLEAYPEESWNDEESKTLDKMELKDVANSLIDTKNPADLKKKMEFSAYKELIAPEKEGAKDWYQMDPEQIGKAMKERGFNPKNRNDVQKFYDKLREHATDYDRARIVKEETEDAALLEKAAFLAYPSLYEESVKQALTGEYDDAKATRAGLTDFAIGTAMGLVPGGLKPVRGITSAGEASLLGIKNPGTTRLLDPVFSGLTDAGIEGVRQVVDAAEGRDFNWGDIGSAGVAAAVVPAAVQGVRTVAKKGNSMYSRPFVKGLLEGSKGAENQLNVERNELKQMLMDARDASKGSSRRTKSGMLSAARSMEDIDKALARDEAKKRLMALGLKSQEDELAAAKKVSDARAAVDAAETSQGQVIDSQGVIPEKARQRMIDYWGKIADNANNELEKAVAEEASLHNRDFFGIPADKYPYVEQVLGISEKAPRKTRVRQNDGSALGSITVPPRPRPDVSPFGEMAEDAIVSKANKAPRKVSIEKILQDYYDKPVKPKIYTPTGHMDKNTLSVYAGQKKALTDFFPEKMKAEGVIKNKDKSYTAGKGLGTILGWYGRRFEPSMGAARKGDERLKQFQESDWFKSLPKEKKNMIEKVLKGE